MTIARRTWRWTLPLVAIAMLGWLVTLDAQEGCGDQESSRAQESCPAQESCRAQKGCAKAEKEQSRQCCAKTEKERSQKCQSCAKREKGQPGQRQSCAKAEKEQSAVAPVVIKATVQGTNFCLRCTLKKQKGAGAQSSVSGHKHAQEGCGIDESCHHALRVTKAAREDGKELTCMRGWVLHYLGCVKCRDLINKHHGEKLIIKGKVYPLERVLEVDCFKRAVSPKKGGGVVAVLMPCSGER